MKKICLLSLLLMVSLLGYSQKSAFNKALKTGREPGKAYRLFYTKGSIIYAESHAKDARDKFDNYAREKDYIILDSKLRRNEKNMLLYDWIDFLPKNEYPQYVLECMNDRKTLSELPNRGGAYYYDAEHNHRVEFSDNIMWSGQVRNGKIQGEGHGVAQINEYKYIGVKGTFVDGILQGAGEFKIYDHYTIGPFLPKTSLKVYNVEIGSFAEGMATFRFKGKYGYISENMKITIPPRYDEALAFSGGLAKVKEGETETKINKDGQTVSLVADTKFTYDQAVKMKKSQPHMTPQLENWVSDYIKKTSDINILAKVPDDFPSLADQTEKRKREIYTNDCQKVKKRLADAIAASTQDNFKIRESRNFLIQFVYQYEKLWHYDPDTIIPLAKDLDNYGRIAWLCDESFENNSYWGYRKGGLSNVFTLGTDKGTPHFEDDKVSEDRNTILNAMRLCNSHGDFGLDEFYKKAYAVLIQKLSDLDNAIDKSIDRYNEAVREHNGKIISREAIENEKQRKADNMTIPSYTTSEWQKPSLISTFHVEKYVYVTYSDKTEGCVGINYDGTYQSERIGPKKRYKTLQDAISAEYVYLMTRKARSIGIVK